MKQTHIYLKILKYIFKKSIKTDFFYIDIFFLFLYPLIILLPPLYYRDIIDYVSSSESVELYYVFTLLGVIFLIHIISIIVWGIEAFFNRRVQPKVMESIYNESFNYIHKHSYNFFSNSFTGALVKKINKLVRGYESIADVISYQIIPLCVSVIFIFSVVFLANIYIGLLFLFLVIFHSIIQYILYKKKIPVSIDASREDSKVIASLSDTISNSLNILTFAKLNIESKNFSHKVNIWKNKMSYSWYREQIIHIVSGFILVLIEIGIIGLSIYFLSIGKISIGTFVLLQIYLFGLIKSLDEIRRIFKSFNLALSESLEMIEIFETKHDIEDIKGSKDIKISRGEIEFRDVSFGYNSRKNIFSNLNLTIKTGEKIAIVGSSGSGKSTLIKLLFRFFDINNGKIFIDGQDISKLNQDSLRKSISMIPQEPILFHRTIKENIFYGNQKASFSDIEKASKMAHCEDFINELDKKYDSYVGERGINLSGGERQRIAIARAVLQSNNIIVLDEATSNLDSQSEKYIQDTMDKVFENKTSIVIAHRLSTIMKMDRIIVLDKGKIVEEGTHKDLILKKGFYNKLWNIQSGKMK